MSNTRRENSQSKISYKSVELQSVPNSGIKSVFLNDGTCDYYSNQCLWVSIIHYLILVENINITIYQLRDIASNNGRCRINDKDSMFDDHYECLLNVLNYFNIKLRMFKRDRESELFYEETSDFHYNNPTLKSNKTVFIKCIGEHFELIYKINDELLYKDVGFDKIYDYLNECSSQISSFPNESNDNWILENEGISTNILTFLQNETYSPESITQDNSPKPRVNSPKPYTQVNSPKSCVRVNSPKSYVQVNSTVEKNTDINTKLSDVCELEIIFENLHEDLKLCRFVNNQELLDSRNENSKLVDELIKTGIDDEFITEIIETHSKQEEIIIKSNLQNETNILTQINEYYQILVSKYTSIIISLRREIELLCEENKNFECIMALQDATEQIKYADIFNQYEYNKICQKGKEKLVNEITIKMDTYYILCDNM